MSWKITDEPATATLFAGLLESGLFDDALHGCSEPSDAALVQRAKTATRQLLALIETELI